MHPDIMIASFLSGLTIILLLYGSRVIMERNINTNRFMPGRYDSKEEPDNIKPKSEVKIPLSRLFLLVAIGGVTSGFSVYLVTGIIWLSLIASLLGLVVPKMWINWHQKGQEKMMLEQLEEAVEIIAAVLKTGGGISEALERAAATVGNPLADELLQVSAEIRLGVSASDAFLHLCQRVPLRELSAIQMAVALAQTGMAISLSSVFTQVQDNIRGFQALEQEVSSLTVENRMAGWIVGAIPFAIIAFMRWIAPGFIAPLFVEPVGIGIFAFCLSAILIGIVWISKMADASNLV